MRMTFGELVQSAQDFCIDATTTTTTALTDSQTFLKREINNSVKDLFTLMKKYSLQPLPKTTSTVASQIYYHYPPGLSKLESVVVPLGNLNIPLRVVHSQAEWDNLHTVPITSNYPEAVFPRRDDFGIWPTPSTAVTMTIVGNYQPSNMTVDDYNTGTVTVAQNSTTVTGSSTAFTSSMVGSYFMVTDANNVPSGSWYRISAYTSATVITLESYFEEATVTAGTFIIADSPDIPEELHEFIPYRAAAIYYANRRRDLDQSQRLMNFYYTGDFANLSRRGNIRGGVLAVLKDLQENGRGNSQLTDMAGKPRQPVLMGGIWSTVIEAS